MTCLRSRAVPGALFVLLMLATVPAVLGQGGHQTTDQPPSVKPRTPRPVPQRPAVQVPKPENPDAIRATFQVDGKEVTLTEGQFYDAYLLLKPHEDRPKRPLQANRVLEHILLLAEAEAMGLVPTEEETELLNPLKANPQFAPALKQRWQAQGITEAQQLQYIRETRAVQRLKSWFASTVRVRSSQIYDLWKKDNNLYRVAYVEFPAAGLEADLRQTPPDEATLEKYWNTKPQVQNLYRTPTSVTADVVSFDPSQVSPEELERIRGVRKIDRTEALGYFRQNHQRLVAQIPSDKRPLLYPPRGTKVPVKDLVTPFQLLRGAIEREILLGDRISKAFEEAASAKSSDDIAALAKKHGLTHVRLEQSSRSDTLSKHSEFGPDIFNDLFNAAPGAIAPALKHHGSLRLFWRLESKAVSSLPPFEEVKDAIIENYYKDTAYENAQANARAFLEAVNESITSETGEAEAALDKKAAEDAEAEIKSQGLTDERQKNAIRQKNKAYAGNQKRILRASKASKHFDEVVAAKGASVKEFGPFSFLFQQSNREELATRDEKIAAFLKNSYQIKALEPGHITVAPLSDIVTRTHFIVKVLAREEPPFERMSATDYHQRRREAERQAIFTTNYRWSLFQARKRLNYKDQ